MGVVHRAYDSVLEREVALKELMTGLAQDNESVSRFRHEAKVLAQLTHPGIIQVYDFIEEAGRIWIVMELVKGGELTDLLKEQGWIAVSVASRLGVQMAEAMAYAHARGVVHRDFKPSNVLLTPGGSPKISDFGLAKLVRSVQHTEAGILMGTPAYMSLEQAKGRTADNRSDIYSMGVVLYQMLTGRLPFEGDDFAGILAQHMNQEPIPLRSIVADIPEELEDLVLRMLHKDPARRVQDMRAVADALRAYAHH
jgi:serine/threonine-protein kinase